MIEASELRGETEKLNLTTLKVRMERGDLIKLHKIESGLYKLKWVVDYERGLKEGK